MAYATGVAALTSAHYQPVPQCTAIISTGLITPPLFRFLLSKVGHQWDNVFSEANARLDRPDPVFWMVALHESDTRDYVVLDENSYYSGLCVDEAGLLQKVNPQLTPEQMNPVCDGYTHTFNGVVFAQPLPRKRRPTPTITPPSPQSPPPRSTPIPRIRNIKHLQRTRC